MSVKIYDGFRLRKNQNESALGNVVFLERVLREAQRQIQAAAHSCMICDIVKQAVRYSDMRRFDGLDINGTDESRTPFENGKRAIDDLIFPSRNQPHQDENHKVYDCGITIHPVSCERVLGIIFTENNRIHDRWFELDLSEFGVYIEDYHYQDQSDRPDDITEQEWTQRRQEWETVLLDHSGVPVNEGFYRKLTDSTMVWMDANLSINDNPAIMLNYVPSFEERAKHIAVMCLEREFKRQTVRTTEELEQPSSTGSLLRRYLTFARSDEGRAKYKESMDYAKQHLNQEVTLAELTS